MPDAATAPAPPTPARPTAPAPAAAPSVEEFTGEIESFLEANTRRKEAEKKFVWGEGSDTVAMFEERDRATERRPAGGRLRVARQALRCRVRLDHRSARVRRTRPVDAPTSAPTTRSSPSTTFPTRASSRSGSAWSRRRSSPTAAPPPRIGYLRSDVPRRHRRLSAVLRAGRRQRPGEPADQGRARRRRVGDHRAEGVDHRRPVLRHRRDHRPHRSRAPQAQGSHRVHRRHAGARRRGAAAASDDRRGQLQRGLLQRGTRARRRPPRRPQQRMERRPHHADERALGDRRRRRGRQQPADPPHRDDQGVRVVRRSARAPGAGRPRDPVAGAEHEQPARPRQDPCRPDAGSRDEHGQARRDDDHAPHGRLRRRTCSGRS